MLTTTWELPTRRLDLFDFQCCMGKLAVSWPPANCQIRRTSQLCKTRKHVQIYCICSNYSCCRMQLSLKQNGSELDAKVWLFLERWGRKKHIGPSSVGIFTWHQCTKHLPPHLELELIWNDGQLDVHASDGWGFAQDPLQSTQRKRKWVSWKVTERKNLASQCHRWEPLWECFLMDKGARRIGRADACKTKDLHHRWRRKGWGWDWCKVATRMWSEGTWVSDRAKAKRVWVDGVYKRILAYLLATKQYFCGGGEEWKMLDQNERSPSLHKLVTPYAMVCSGKKDWSRKAGAWWDNKRGKAFHRDQRATEAVSSWGFWVIFNIV